MTPRGAGLLLGGVLLCVLGWYAGWPELTALGAGAAGLVLAAVVATLGAPPVRVRTDTSTLHVVRDQRAVLRVSVTSTRRRRALRLVEGSVSSPVRTVPVPAGPAGEPCLLEMPVDTSIRGQHPLGPFTVVRGDPWSIVRRGVGSAPPGSVLVRPRTWPVRRGLGTSQQVRDADAMSRSRGDDHFFALRDYVLGDEPRTVHWRSSARSGRLVVKQKVAAASDGTLLVLDVDSAAYRSREAFSDGYVADRFEAAVEVAASLATSVAGAAERTRFTTTAAGSATVTADAGGARLVLDALAVVAAVPPIVAAPAELPTLLRRTGCSRLVVVSGSPSAGLLDVLRAAARSASSVLLVRVGADDALRSSTVTVLDVAGPGDLA